MTGKVSIKTEEELQRMVEGGGLLGKIKKATEEKIKEGVGADEIENFVTAQIDKTGGKPSFKMVPGYKWSTCVNINDGLVHGIPHKSIIFKDGDVVSVDMGLFYKNMHTDTSLSVLVGTDPKKKKFLRVGRKALDTAIKQVKKGNSIKDVSRAMEEGLVKNGLMPVRALVGHGIGKKLHEYPPVPCFVSGSLEQEIVIKEGMALAVEIMYTKGNVDVVLEKDGWTVSTKSGRISGLFEETVVISRNGPHTVTA